MSEINISDIPNNWVLSPLDDILINFESGSRPKGGVKGIKSGIPSVGGEHLNKYGSFNFSETKFVPEEFFKDMKKGKIKLGDILIVKDGATTGKTSIVREDFPFKKAAVNEHVFLTRPYNGINNLYLFYYLFSPYGQHFVKKNFKGTAQGGINLSFFKNTNVPIPPLNEQKRIVIKMEELFTRLDAGVGDLERTKEQLKVYRQSLLKYAFEGKLTKEWREAHKDELETASVLLERIKKERKEQLGKKYKEIPPIDETDLPNLPMEWKWVFLIELGELNRGKSKHRPRNDERLFSGKYPFIQTGDVKNSDGYIRNFTQTYNDFGLNQSKLWPVNTLCITIAANIADTALLSISACFPDSIVGFNANSRFCNVKYIYYFINSIKSKLESFAPATAQKNINLTTLRNVNVPYTDILEQNEIVSEIEKRLSIIHENEKAINNSLLKATQFRLSILKKAFQGQLVPQNPEDEPATALLERINAEKEKNKPKKKRKKRKKKINSKQEVLV